MSRPAISAVLAIAALAGVPSGVQAQSPEPDTHASHASHATGDTHAGHGVPASTPATTPVPDPHAMHRNAGQAGPHAGHGTTAGDDPHAMHHGAARDEDPHAGHAMAAASPGLPREPVPEPTDADRAAAFPELHAGHEAHGSAPNSLVRFNRFEAWDAQPGSGQAWEGSAWFGGDVQRLWLRSEGEREHGRTGAADLEVLYGRGISPWWDLVAGVRHDFAPGPSQTWVAFGVQGMAPYKFEVSATAYLGEHGQSAFIAEVEYELLLTNRLVLQPLVEVELHGRDDPQRGIGPGLSSAEAGLRLRYEVTRRFAPYIGLVHERTFGDTADYRRDEGEAARDTRWVAGVRWWF